ncbi:DUF3375 domain-containing protein [Humibacter ginsengisoli]
MELDELDRLWERHPAWRLLRARNVPLVLSFLGGWFIEENRGAVPLMQLVAALDDVLYDIHRTDPERYPSEPASYIDDWSGPDAALLRRFYPVGSEEVHVEATPALEKAYRWVEGLRTREFVGTESRLQTLIDLLRQIVHGSETDPDARVAELERRRDELESELAAARAGEFDVLDETRVRDRYQQFAATARELLSDFREVEENFRALDRTAREKIAGWDAGKGALLADLIESRTDIASSDQGRSFQSFYDFLLSEGRQDELSDLLAAVQTMPQISADRRLRRIHHDWADAAERTQQTVRNLSEQLRRFLEDAVWVENRRVRDLVRGIEAAALATRETPPRADALGLVVDEPGVPVVLPFERPLYDPQPDVVIENMPAPQRVDDLDLDSLFGQRFVDTARLAGNIRTVVPRGSSALLSDIVELYPIMDGVAELLGYLALGDDDIDVIAGDGEATIDYTDAGGTRRRVQMPEVTVTRR